MTPFAMTGFAMTVTAMTAWLIETLVATTLLMAAALLLRAPVRRALITICPISRTETLKRGLKMVRMRRTSRLASAGGALAVGMTALAGLTLTATSGIAAQAVASPRTIIIKRAATKEEADAALGTALDGRCGNPARVVETKAKLRDALAASTGRPVRVVTLECVDGSKTPAERAARLETAIAGVKASDQFAAAKRAEIVAALEVSLAEARAAE